MEVLLAFDGDAAGRKATLRAIPMLIRAMSTNLVAYEFIPGLVSYQMSMSYRNPGLLRWKKRREVMLTDIVREWHTELRYMADASLELWIINLKRDIAEDELENDVSWSKGTLAALEAEKERRAKLAAEKGAPEYQPGPGWKQRIAENRVQKIKEHFSGEEFIHLFEQVTGIRPLLVGRSWKYACPVHGDGVDKTPAGSIDPDRGLWHCFVCGSGGDVFQLLYAWPPHLPFKEAMDDLWGRMQ